MQGHESPEAEETVLRQLLHGRLPRAAVARAPGGLTCRFRDPGPAPGAASRASKGSGGGGGVSEIEPETKRGAEEDRHLPLQKRS